MKFDFEVAWEPYQEQLTKWYGDQHPLDQDLKELILWTKLYQPKFDADSAVRQNIKTLPYYRKLKQLFPNYAHHHEIPEILMRVINAYREPGHKDVYVNRKTVCKLAIQVYEVQKASRKIDDYPPMDSLLLDAVCGLVKRKPHLEPTVLARDAVLIRATVLPYLLKPLPADGSQKIYRSDYAILEDSYAGYYIDSHTGYGMCAETTMTLKWIAQTHPFLSDKLALDWAKDIVRSTGYRTVVQKFTTNYPYYQISFSITVTGTVTLDIYSENYMVAPCLDFFAQRHKNAKRLYNYVEFTFDLNNPRILNSFIESVHTIFKEIEYELKPEVDDGHFNDKKWSFLLGAKQFVQDFLSGFPGLKLSQRTVPREQKEEKHPDLDLRNMQELIKQADVDAIEFELAKGFDPNQDIYGLSLLSQCFDKLPDYTVYLLPGVPTNKQLEELVAFVRYYHVIIAKLPQGYYLYSAQCKPVPITNPKDVSFLNNLPEPYFQYEPDKTTQTARTGKHTEDVYRLVCLIQPYVQDTLEVNRREKARKKLTMTQLFLEYESDPHYKPQDHTSSPMSQLIDCSHRLCYTVEGKNIRLPDSANAWLLESLIPLFMRSDRGRTQLRVHSDILCNDPVATLIHECSKALRLEGRQSVPLLLKDVYKSRDRIEIRNDQNEVLTLETKAFSQLTKEEWQNVRDLYLDIFRALTKKSDTHLCADFEQELSCDPKFLSNLKKQGGYFALIDLIKNEHGQLVAFNTAKVFVPKKGSESILHYIPLACAQKWVSDHFSRLMSIVSFQLTMNLQMRHNDRRLLTIFSAVSASSYLQTVGLTVYPKHDCILPKDMDRIEQFCYGGQAAIKKGFRRFYPSTIFYETPKKAMESSTSPISGKDIPSLADLNREGFNQRMSLKGHETVVAFYATLNNLLKLAHCIDRRLSSGLRFIDVVTKAESMTARAIQYQIAQAKL